MDETLWELFWTTGLPEAYALAKEAGGHTASLPGTGTGGASPSPTNADIRREPL